MRYKNLFSFGVRMLFLAPNGCKGSYFLRYLSIKKKKVRKSLAYSKNICTFAAANKKMANRLPNGAG